MSEDVQARQDDPNNTKPSQMSPEEDAARIERLKASHGSHHTAGGCADQRAEATQPAE